MSREDVGSLDAGQLIDVVAPLFGGKLRLASVYGVTRRLDEHGVLIDTDGRGYLWEAMVRYGYATLKERGPAVRLDDFDLIRREHYVLTEAGLDAITKRRAGAREAMTDMTDAQIVAEFKRQAESALHALKAGENPAAVLHRYTRHVLLCSGARDQMLAILWRMAQDTTWEGPGSR